MPSGIKFGDTIASVLYDLEITTDSFDGSVMDIPGGELLLYSDEYSTFKLIDCKATVENYSKTLYRYKLLYTEITPAIRRDGSESEITRHLEISFKKNTLQLGKLRVYVGEEFKVNN